MVFSDMGPFKAARWPLLPKGLAIMGRAHVERSPVGTIRHRPSMALCVVLPHLPVGKKVLRFLSCVTWLKLTKID